MHSWNVSGTRPHLRYKCWMSAFYGATEVIHLPSCFVLPLNLVLSPTLTATLPMFAFSSNPGDIVLAVPFWSWAAWWCGWSRVYSGISQLR